MGGSECGGVSYGHIIEQKKSKARISACWDRQCQGDSESPNHCGSNRSEGRYRNTSIVLLTSLVELFSWMGSFLRLYRIREAEAPYGTIALRTSCILSGREQKLLFSISDTNISVFKNNPSSRWFGSWIMLTT